ncbi:MAG: hypothetical protein M3P18_04565 [Actinomycetota bacterium]|nr:hypothetical protein [Actinomycetota bacterium]
MSRYLLLPFACCAGLLAGCPFDVIRVEQTPVELVYVASSKAFVLEQDVPISLGFGYNRVLRKGTRWTYVGAISNGDVYKTNNQVLTVEASNIHEAYIVLEGRKLVGFYLPVERTYTPAAESKSLPTKEAQ